MSINSSVARGLGAGTSVTLHIYDMPAHIINSQEEVVDRRNFDKIYTKDKSAAENGHPTGKEPYRNLHVHGNIQPK